MVEIISHCLSVWAGLNLEVTVPSIGTCYLARAANNLHLGPIITSITRKVIVTELDQSPRFLRHPPILAPIQNL